MKCPARAIAAFALTMLVTAVTGCYTSRFEQMDQRMAEIQAELRHLAVQDSVALARLNASAAGDDQSARATRADAASRHAELLQAIENLRTALIETRDRPGARAVRVPYATPPSYAVPDTSVRGVAPPDGSNGSSRGGSFSGDIGTTNPGAPAPTGGDSAAMGSNSAGTTPLGGTIPSAGDTANPDDVRAAYDAARLDLTRGNFDLAASGFREFLRQYPDAELADNAQYWLGECYYAEKKFQDAAAEFANVVDRYPDGDKVGSALLKLSYCQLALGNKADGVNLLERVSRDYPGTPEARQADERLEQMGEKR